MTAYATRRHVYQFGLARGAIGSNARLVEAARAATDAFELDEHGFETDDAITFRATEGGALPAPIAAGTSYYAIRLTDSTFQVAASRGGSPIDLTTDGVSVRVLIALPFDEVLEFYSRFVDGLLPAHLVPLTAPYPVVVVAIVAELAAKKLQLIAGQSSVSMTEIELGAKAQIERWATGQPIRDAAVTRSSNLAVAEPAGDVHDQRGWGSSQLP